MKYNFKKLCPSCKCPWNDDDGCSGCGFWLCGYEADKWVRKDFGNIIIFWEDDGTVMIKTIINNRVFPLLDMEELPFNITLEQLKLYLTFS